MSTLKLKGSTSGYVELTAPATAGDNQIVLPTTAGTVAVKDASGNTEVGTGVTIGSPSSNVFTVSTNGSERIRVDSSGNINVDSGGVYYDAVNNRLAVGTTSPSVNLDIVGPGATYAQLRGGSSSNQGSAYLVRDAANTATLAAFGDTSAITGGTPDQSVTIFSKNNIPIVFYSSSERARIDSSGRLLVGTFSTSESTTAVFQGRPGDANGAGTIFLQGNYSGLADSIYGEISFKSTGGTLARISGIGDLAHSGDAPGRLVFSTTADGASSPTERMRISQTGQVTISHGAVGADVVVATHTSSSFANAILSLATTRAAGTACLFIYGAANAVNTFNVFNNGNVTNANNSYTAISDSKLKENIFDAASQWDDIKNLKVRKYNFKPETGHSTHTQIGLIAQETETVSPGLVDEVIDRDEDGNDLGTVTKSVNYSVLYMKAVKALQEAMERIETLEAENATLKSDFTALATRVAALESA